MRGDPVVPDHDRLGCPLNPTMQVLAVSQMVVQKLEKHVALLLLETDDVARELWVDV
jgi:hypothetical protein